MRRPIRIEYPRALYHVTSRGNERRKIFFDERDRRKFLSILADYHGRYGVLIHAYMAGDVVHNYHSCLLPKVVLLMTVAMTENPTPISLLSQLGIFVSSRLKKQAIQWPRAERWAFFAAPSAISFKPLMMASLSFLRPFFSLVA